MTSACADQANIKMQKTGAEGAFNGPSLLPASDLGVRFHANGPGTAAVQTLLLDL